MVDGGEIIYELSEDRLKEIMTPEATYTNTGDAKFMLATVFGAASKYTDDLSAAVRRGNRSVLADGKVPGPVPIGYLKTHEHERTPGAGTVVPDPERYDIVRQIWKSVLAGETNLSAVWRKARDEWRLATRPTTKALCRPIALTNIYHILRNPFYAGRIIREGKTYRGEHVPMVTAEEFERVQILLAHTNSEQHAKHVHARLLYSGLLHCDHCGRLLVGEQIRGRYVYYRCGRRRAGYVQCHAPAVTENNVTRAVLATLRRVTIDAKLRDWAMQAIDWWAGNDEMTPVGMVKKADRELAKAERELATLTDLVVQEMITTEEYKVTRMNQLKRIEHLRESLAEPAERVEAWAAAKQELANGKLEFCDAFAKADDEEQRQLVTRVFSDVIITNRIAQPVPRVPFVLRANEKSKRALGETTHFC